MNHIILGIFPPDISSVLLPIIIFGGASFLLSYFHRYFGVLVVPIFIGYCVYTINFLEFFVDLTSNYMLIVYLTMIFSVIAILIGTRISWNRFNKKLQILE